MIKEVLCSAAYDKDHDFVMIYFMLDSGLCCIVVDPSMLDPRNFVYAVSKVRVLSLGEIDD